MRKLTLFLTMTLMAMVSWATNYTGTLTVTIDGESSSLESTIALTQSGSDYTLSINNFMLEGIPVGNIVVTAPGTTANGLTSIVTSQNITITAGDASVSDFWLGPELGIVPINMVLAFNQYALTTNIDIYMAELEQNINVKFAMDGELTGYQIKNSGFENFKNNGEPFAWHGFKSATGTFASLSTGKLEESTEVRSGATGKCALLTSGTKIGTAVPNGTMTTGRLNAGSMSATSTSNCSKMNMSDTDTDANGDPFYTVMHGRPDALKFWLKFTQGTSTSSYPYCTVSAIITDGTAYQDPEDKTYNNRLATAKKSDMVECGWTEFTVPFNYKNESINGQALLVTFSTNATAGKGSSGDKVWVDDIAMVYNAAIGGISVKGSPLAGFSPDVYEYTFDMDADGSFSDSDIEATLDNCPHAYLVKKAVETENGYKLFVAVVSNDLNTTKVYTISYNKPAVPATATLYVYSPVEAPAVDGTTLTETVTGQHVTWYKYEVTDVETAFPKTLAVTAGNGQQDVELAADATVYLSMADGMVDEGYNPFAGNEFTIWVRNMDNEMVAPHIYAWDQVGNKVAGEWPGTELTESETLDDGFKWFRYTLNDVEKAQFIFSLNGNNQTDNLESTAPEAYFYYYPSRGNQADRAELTERPVAPATSTLYVYSPEEAPVINGEIALSETVTGEHVIWYKYELTDKVTAFPMHITVTAGNGQQDVELAADATVYLSMADGMVNEGFNPFAGNEFTIWVRNMDDENMAPTFYAWDQVGNKVAGEWSGTQLSESEILEDTHIWWRYVLTDVEKAQFIFSLDGNSQTDNLESTAPEAFFYYYPSRDNQSERAELTERPVAPATSTLYVYSPEEAPVINGEIALSETVTGEHVIWYKYELTDKVTAFPMHITVTAGNGQQDVELAADATVYLSMAHGVVGEDYNPFDGNEFTIWVRNMDDDNVAPTFYAWNQVGTEMAGEWSGTQLSESEILADAHRWYKTTLIDVEKAQFIFSLNGDCQSDNLESTAPEAFFYYYPSRGNQSERVERIDVVPEVATVTVAELVANEGTVDNPEETLVDSEITIYERWSEVFGGATLWHMSAFDGEGNWLDVTTTDGDNLPEIGTKYLARSFRASVFTYGMSTQQDVNLVLMLDQADVQLIEVETGEPLSALQTYRLYSMTSDDVPVLNQTIVLMGYYNANDGALRAFSPNNGPQGMGVKLFGNHNLVDGKRYAITGVLYDRYSHDYVLPENAPIHLNAIDDEQYQGIGKIQLFGLAMSQSVEPTVTAIDNLNGVAVVREVSGIYNVRGQRVDDITEPGVYIIRYTDGSAIKVRK